MHWQGSSPSACPEGETATAAGHRMVDRIHHPGHQKGRFMKRPFLFFADKKVLLFYFLLIRPGCWSNNVPT
jgi:hypothetical protein